jgi:hypothetical protein
VDDGVRFSGGGPAHFFAGVRSADDFGGAGGDVITLVARTAPRR